tara:strand:+ start:82 stop:354 length:273 start_codon:yes stop_codon:yes gene_type:complete
MKTMVEMEGITEKQAIINLQIGLIDSGDYMTQLIDIQEINDDDGGWTLEDGTELDQDSQDALNDAMSTYTNSEGLTLEQAMERASQRKNK